MRGLIPYTPWTSCFRIILCKMTTYYGAIFISLIYDNSAIINFLMIFYLSNGAGQKHSRPARTTTYNLNILSHPITGARIVIRGSSHGDCGIYCFANLGIDQVFAALTRFVATGAAPFTEAAVTSVPASEAPESSTFVMT